MPKMKEFLPFSGKATFEAPNYARFCGMVMRKAWDAKYGKSKAARKGLTPGFVLKTAEQCGIHPPKGFQKGFTSLTRCDCALCQLGRTLVEPFLRKTHE